MWLAMLVAIGFMVVLPAMGRAQSTPAALTLSATSQSPLPVAVGCQVVNSFTPSLTSPADTNCEVTVNSMSWGPAYVTDWTGTNVVGWCNGPDATNGGFNWYWTADIVGLTNFIAWESAQFNITDCTQSNYMITATGSVGFSITNVGAVWAAGGPADLCAGSQALLSAMITPPGRSVTWAVSNADAGVSIALKYGTTTSDASGLATNILIAATNSLSGSATLVAYDSAGNDGMGCGIATWVVAVHAAQLLGIASTYVMVNNDDDDHDGTNDVNAPLTGAGSYVTNEDDLIPIYLSSQGLMATQMVTLSVNPAWWGSGGIRVWAHSTRGPGSPLIDNSNPNLLSTNWPAGSLPGTLWVEGVSASGSLGDVQLTLGTADGCSSSTNLTVFLMQLGADVYHTHNITFDDLSPLYFWINDVGVNGDIIPDGTDIPGSGNNGTSGQVNGRCDVENFTPVGLNFGNTLQLLSPTNGYEYRLIGSGISIVYTSLGMSSAFNYLTDATGTSGYGSGFNVGVYAADTVSVNGYAVLSTSFLTNALNNGGIGLVLMEGGRATSQPLKLEVWKNGQKIGGGGQLNLSIASVEKMYRWINLRLSSGLPTSTDEPTNFPDSLSNGKNVFFLHGFNVSANGARGWNAEVFKRLYSSGSRGKFWGMTWDGDLGVVSPAFFYPANVVSAFATAPNYSNQINNVSGPKIVLAHSLGNMVVSSAIQDYGLGVDKYFMLEAAVAMESFNPAMFSDTATGNALVHEDWIGYNNNTWSAHWHDMFSDDRRNLTWINRFPNVLPVAYNYYSTGDECMELYTNGNPGLFTGATSSFGRYCWQKQELGKGRGGLIGTSWAGWGFATHFVEGSGLPVNDYTPAAANAASPAQLQSHPVFWPSPTTIFSSSISQSDTDNLLAQGIPALSPPTGGDSIGGARVNHNVNTGFFKPNGWGRNPTDTYGTRWLHSDMKDMAYPYTHIIFDTLVSEGGLQ